MKGHTDYIYAVAYSPDGREIVSGSWDNTLRRWDARTGQPLCEPMTGHKGSVHAVAYSPDGREIVSGSYDCTRMLERATAG